MVEIELIDAEQAGKILGQTPRTVREWARKHKIPVTLIGTRRLFNKAELIEFIKQQTLPPKSLEAKKE